MLAPHAAGTRRWADRQVTLSGHAVAETYFVLTRLPDDLRIAPANPAQLLAELRPAPAGPGGRPPDTCRRCSATPGSPGAAVYDALVALAALEYGADLATRDASAKDTYEKIGVRVIVAA